MKNINMLKLSFVALLLGIVLISNSCKRDLEIQNQPQLIVNQSILNAKALVDSLVLQQGPNSYIKKMGFEMNWEKAIIDSAGNIRVPMYFDLSKLKQIGEKLIPPPKTKTVFELFIKKNKAQSEVSIMQFMNFKGKYYPLRFTINGEEKTKLAANISMQDIKMPSKLGDKILSSKPNKTMITESGVIELVQDMYGSGYLAVMIYECAFGNYFNPTTCMCDYPENVESGMFYPEIFMVIITSSGSYQIVPYPFSFHPMSIDPDPEYPDEPIGGGDGTGGDNGDGDDSDDPNLTSTASIAEMTPSASAIALLGSNWGYTEDESVDLTIGASLSNGIWTAVLINATGNYSVQARLIAGVSEVGGTNGTNYCNQAGDLKTVAKVSVNWYMLSAVVAHENVHASRLLPALNDALSAIEADVRTLTVSATGQTKAQAITELMNLAAFQTIKSLARTHWDAKYVNLIQYDHNNNGATDVAENAIVDPVGISICNLKNTNPTWPGCSNCPY